MDYFWFEIVALTCDADAAADDDKAFWNNTLPTWL